MESPVAEKPYETLSEANGRIGAGNCTELSENRELDISTGVATPWRVSSAGTALRTTTRQPRSVLEKETRESSASLTVEPARDSRRTRTGTRRDGTVVSSLVHRDRVVRCGHWRACGSSVVPGGRLRRVGRRGT